MIKIILCLLVIQMQFSVCSCVIITCYVSLKYSMTFRLDYIRIPVDYMKHLN